MMETVYVHMNVIRAQKCFVCRTIKEQYSIELITKYYLFLCLFSHCKLTLFLYSPFKYRYIVNFNR